MLWLLLPAVIIGASIKFFYSSSASRVFVIGDSQACGITGAASPCGSIPNNPDCARLGQSFEKIRPFLGSTARVRCTVGGHTRDWTTGLLLSLGIKEGDTLIVFLGSNDYDALPDPSTIINFVVETNCRLLWVGPPAIRGKVGVAPDHLASLLHEAYFDSRVLNLKLTDGIHPSPAEYKRWAAEVQQILT